MWKMEFISLSTNFVILSSIVIAAIVCILVLVICLALLLSFLPLSEPVFLLPLLLQSDFRLLFGEMNTYMKKKKKKLTRTVFLLLCD